ncbi:MAG: DUF4124 domain-containing protein [Methylococcaceae bacterium]|jgi:hypothetical protein
MRTFICLMAICFIFIGLLGGQAAYAKKLYKWVDANGNTYFSDQIPPEHVQYGRQTLNQKGAVVGVLEQAKTKEQQELDQRLEKLRAQQQQIIAEQKAHDKVLLSTFRSLDDMEAMLNGKKQAMDAQLGVLEGNLKRLQDLLDNQHKKAASHERNGQKIPKALLAEIKNIESQIASTHEEIDKQTDKKTQAMALFGGDMERYKFLTQDVAQTQKRSDTTAQLKAADELGLYNCKNEVDCNKAWQVAHQFIQLHSSTPKDIDNDKLVMSLAPIKDSDLSLSVSKIAVGNNTQQLFLDIRCRQSSLGAELCASDKIKAIRSAFRPYIEAGLASD